MSEIQVELEGEPNINSTQEVAIQEPNAIKGKTMEKLDNEDMKGTAFFNFYLLTQLIKSQRHYFKLFFLHAHN